MNKNSTIFKISILIFSVFALVNCRNTGNNSQSYSQNNNEEKPDSGYMRGKHLPIAYINIDSLLLHYSFAKDANEELMKEQENSRATLNARMKKLQSDAAEFQRKLDNNAFLSRDRAEEEGKRLQQQDQDLQNLSSKLQDQFYAKQQKLNEQLRDTINIFLKEFNKGHKYEMIISNTANDNILWAAPSYDITKDVIDALNNRMNK
ncbi:MAG: OmpH family outer membrane protein [Paludibacter sp.]|nr:OmpH family outer membrane protein [Paludibacter sp.]